VPPSKRDNCVPCRHQLDNSKIVSLIKLLRGLPKAAPELIQKHGIDPVDYDLLFRSAIESIRGVFSATAEDKRKFLQVVFDKMKDSGAVKEWQSIGTKGRQDYRIMLPNKRSICVEAKGCPDGNNMNIWERPTWAEEFIVWSQCPDSLQHNPGHGIWSGVSVRLVPKMVVERQQIDAFVFYDGRCGSKHRQCPKSFGLTDDLRSKATDVKGYPDSRWMPPPTIYLFPRTIPHPHTNKQPPVHDLRSCQFANALLETFKVPRAKREEYTNWVKVETKADSEGNWIKIAIGFDLNKKDPAMEGDFKRLRRE
jgi:hypothetical protein